MDRYISRVLELAEKGAIPKKDAAVIVDPKSNIVFPFDILGEGYNTKERGVNFHATLNAIVNASKNLAGCTLYVKYYPCNECAKLILVSGIKKVVHIIDDIEDDSEEDDGNRELFESENVKNKMHISVEKLIKTEDMDLEENGNRNNQLSGDRETHIINMKKALDMIAKHCR